MEGGSPRLTHGVPSRRSPHGRVRVGPYTRPLGLELGGQGNREERESIVFSKIESRSGSFADHVAHDNVCRDQLTWSGLPHEPTLPCGAFRIGQQEIAVTETLPSIERGYSAGVAACRDSASSKRCCDSPRLPPCCRTAASCVRRDICKNASPLRSAYVTDCSPTVTAVAISPRKSSNALRLLAIPAAFFQFLP